MQYVSTSSVQNGTLLLPSLTERVRLLSWLLTKLQDRVGHDLANYRFLTKLIASENQAAVFFNPFRTQFSYAIASFTEKLLHALPFNLLSTDSYYIKVSGIIC